jgi:bacterioferritin
MADQAMNQEVVAVLNDALTAELTAINQYFLHAEMCRHWGYSKLYDFIRKNAIEEMKHAEELMERILYIGGLPNVQRLSPIQIGETVLEQFKVDLDLEKVAVDRLNKGIETCRAAADNGSRMLLERILADEEAHIDWLDAQLEALKKVGEQNYLAQQI